MIGWIRVEDDKPEYDVDVIIFTPRDHDMSPKTIIGWFTSEGYWASSQANEDEDIFPTHWMPKPLDPVEPILPTVETTKYEIPKSDLCEVVCNLKMAKKRLMKVERLEGYNPNIEVEILTITSIIDQLNQ
jgi:hypothetical protein